MQDPSDNNLRVALYCRVSTEEQREGQTIESQIKELERFANDKNWIIVGIYKDEGWSGSLLARPELDHLRDDASRGLFNAILINDVDRLARDVTHLGVVKRDFERKAVRVIFRKLPGEDSPVQNLLINVLGSFAEFERELISDRTRRGRRYKVEVRKQFLGSIAPYGFRYLLKGSADSVTGKLEIRPEEASVVVQMYRWVDDEGLSIRKVLKRLNEIGSLPRKGGRVWRQSSVRRILRSEVYAGVWHYNKHQLCVPKKQIQQRRYRKSPRSSLRVRPKSEWLPVILPAPLHIVDPALWRRVQEQLTRNITFSPRNAKHIYLLSGLMQCGGCQSVYSGEPSHGYFSYRCSKRCKAFSAISEHYLDETVWNAVSAALLAPDIILQAATDIDEHANATSEMDRESEEMGRRLEQIQKEELRLLEAYRLEILSPEQLAQQLQNLKARRTLVQSTKARLDRSAQINGTTARKSIEEYCRQISEKLATLDKERRRQVLRLLIKRVVFEGDRVRIRGIIPIARDFQAAVGDDGGDPSLDAGRIATTTSWPYDRNVADNPEVTAPDRSCGTLVFELIETIHKDTSAADAARKNNLMKANAAVKKMRSAK